MTSTHTIPGVEIELQGDQTAGRSVLLKQEFGGTVHQVELQEVHVRWLAEKFGAADTAGLQRALLRIEAMARELHKNLEITHGYGQEDLTTELSLSQPLVDFLAFVCDGFRELPESAAQTPAAPAAKPAGPRTATKTGELFAEGSRK